MTVSKSFFTWIPSLRQAIDAEVVQIGIDGASNPDVARAWERSGIGIGKIDDELIVSEDLNPAGGAIRLDSQRSRVAGGHTICEGHTISVIRIDHVVQIDPVVVHRYFVM